MIAASDAYRIEVYRGTQYTMTPLLQGASPKQAKRELYDAQPKRQRNHICPKVKTLKLIETPISLYQ